MSDVSAASSSTSTSSSSSSSSTSNLNLDAETFLQLMVAQMQYQDPLEPQTDSDFLAQLAQVTASESMEEMKTAMNTTKDYSMIGKYVVTSQESSESEDEVVQGIVSSVFTYNGTNYLIVDDQQVAVDSVTQVFDSSTFDTGGFETYSAFLGKYVSATYTDSNSKAVTVEGIVKSMYQGSDGAIYLQVADVDTGDLSDVAGMYVTSVSEEAPTTTSTTTDSTSGG